LLSEGGEVEIVQRLGASITVRTELGSLLRVEAADADALGLEPVGAEVSFDGERDFDMSQVFDALGQVYDPEIPVSIVELGLVYRCEEHEGPLGTRRIEIDMSMTAPGCGMGDILASEVDAKVRALPGVRESNVELVFDPPWELSMMPESARLALGMY
jgi:probable FeS assembly SUF system protein SufT